MHSSLMFLKRFHRSFPQKHETMIGINQTLSKESILPSALMCWAEDDRITREVWPASKRLARKDHWLLNIRTTCGATLETAHRLILRELQHEAEIHQHTFFSSLSLSQVKKTSMNISIPRLIFGAPIPGQSMGIVEGMLHLIPRQNDGISLDSTGENVRKKYWFESVLNRLVNQTLRHGHGRVRILRVIPPTTTVTSSSSNASLLCSAYESTLLLRCIPSFSHLPSFLSRVKSLRTNGFINYSSITCHGRHTIESIRMIRLLRQNHLAAFLLCYSQSLMMNGAPRFAKSLNKTVLYLQRDSLTIKHMAVCFEQLSKKAAVVAEQQLNRYCHTGKSFDSLRHGVLLLSTIAHELKMTATSANAQDSLLILHSKILCQSRLISPLALSELSHSVSLSHWNELASSRLVRSSTQVLVGDIVSLQPTTAEESPPQYDSMNRRISEDVLPYHSPVYLNPYHNSSSTPRHHHQNVLKIETQKQASQYSLQDVLLPLKREKNPINLVKLPSPVEFTRQQEEEEEEEEEEELGNTNPSRLLTDLTRDSHTSYRRLIQKPLDCFVYAWRPSSSSNRDSATAMTTVDCMGDTIALHPSDETTLTRRQSLRIPMVRTTMDPEGIRRLLLPPRHSHSSSFNDELLEERTAFVSTDETDLSVALQLPIARSHIMTNRSSFLSPCFNREFSTVALSLTLPSESYLSAALREVCNMEFS